MFVSDWVHSLLAQSAQIHHYGELIFGSVFGLMWLVFTVRLAETAQRRSRRNLFAAHVANVAVALVSGAYLYDSRIPLRPHHIGLVPTHGTGAILLMSGMCTGLLGVLLIPNRAASRWIPDANTQSQGAEANVWPPPPRVKPATSEQTDANRNLLAAAQAGDIEQVLIALDTGADVNVLSAVGSPGADTPLMLAAMFGHTALVELLLSRGADPNTETPSESGVATRTALTLAAVNGEVEIVRLLLHYGANVYATNSAGQTALLAARDKARHPGKPSQMRQVVALLAEAARA